MSGRLGRRQYHWFFNRAVHLHISAGFHNERGHGLLVAFDYGACGYTEARAGMYIYPTFEEIYTLAECHIAGEVEILGAVAQFTALIEENAAAIGNIPFVGHRRVGDGWGVRAVV